MGSANSRNSRLPDPPSGAMPNIRSMKSIVDPLSLVLLRDGGIYAAGLAVSTALAHCTHRGIFKLFFVTDGHAVGSGGAPLHHRLPGAGAAWAWHHAYSAS